MIKLFVNWNDIVKPIYTVVLFDFYVFYIFNKDIFHFISVLRVQNGVVNIYHH